MPLHFKNRILNPSHPWQKERIEYEKELLKKYGLRRKKEIWRMNYILYTLKYQAKKLVARTGPQAEVEKQNLFNRVKRLNLLRGDFSYDDILALTVEDLMERRLQTMLVRKGLARTMKQARQMIVHGHIMVGDKVITSPSYLVKANEENKISYHPKSSFNNPDHPELNLEKKEVETQAEQVKSAEDSNNEGDQ